MGWVGDWGDLRKHLEVLGADKDANGEILLCGATFTFMGEARRDEAEVAIKNGTKFFIDGEAHDLVEEANKVCIGMNVIVLTGAGVK